jgi:hypothetical protein
MPINDRHTTVAIPEETYENLIRRLSITRIPLSAYIRTQILAFMDKINKNETTFLDTWVKRKKNTATIAYVMTSDEFTRFKTFAKNSGISIGEIVTHLLEEKALEMVDRK